MTDSNGSPGASALTSTSTTAGDPAAYDSYSDRDDNSSIAPFPPYRDDGILEEEEEDEVDEVVEQVVDAYGPVDESDLPTPTPATTAESRVRLFSDAAQPKSPTESASESIEPSTPPKPPSPQPAPPPPYWKHSRDSSSASIPSQPPAAAESTPIPPPKPKSKPRGLSIFARPASRPTSSKRSGTCPVSPSQPNTSPSPNSTSQHRRDTSSSTLDFAANLITLQDNEAEPPATSPSPNANANAWLFGREDPPPPPTSPKKHSWARRVDITDHVVVNGASSLPLSLSTNHPRIGAFVVWTVRVETLDLPSSTFSIYKRYSEFDALRRRLASEFTQARGALPPLPPKSVLGKFKPSFLEQRRLGLQYFLNCILLNPEFSGSPILKEFLFE